MPCEWNMLPLIIGPEKWVNSQAILLFPSLSILFEYLNYFPDPMHWRCNRRRERQRETIAKNKKNKQISIMNHKCWRFASYTSTSSHCNNMCIRWIYRSVQIATQLDFLCHRPLLSSFNTNWPMTWFMFFCSWQKHNSHLSMTHIFTRLHSNHRQHSNKSDKETA